MTLPDQSGRPGPLRRRDTSRHQVQQLHSTGVPLVVVDDDPPEQLVHIVTGLHRPAASSGPR